MELYTNVAHEEFLQFLSSYPNPLATDTTGICEPPVTTWNDFSRGVWPKSIVARAIRNDLMPHPFQCEIEYAIITELL